MLTLDMILYKNILITLYHKYKLQFVMKHIT